MGICAAAAPGEGDAGGMEFSRAGREEAGKDEAELFTGGVESVQSMDG